MLWRAFNTSSYRPTDNVESVLKCKCLHGNLRRRTYASGLNQRGALMITLPPFPPIKAIALASNYRIRRMQYMSLAPITVEASHLPVGKTRRCRLQNS